MVLVVLLLLCGPPAWRAEGLSCGGAWLQLLVIVSVTGVDVARGVAPCVCVCECVCVAGQFT